MILCAAARAGGGGPASCAVAATAAIGTRRSIPSRADAGQGSGIARSASC